MLKAQAELETLTLASGKGGISSTDGGSNIL